MSSTVQSKLDAALKGPAFEKRIRRRNIADAVSKYGISIGGMGVIFSVLLIMFFLLYVVMPLFVSPTIEKASEYSLPGGKAEKSIFYGVDEYQSSAIRFAESGKLIGFKIADGAINFEEALPLNGATITAHTIVDEIKQIIAFGLSDGRVIFAQYGYDVSYPDNVRTITPKVTYPFGEEPLEIADSAISLLAVKSSESEIRLAYKLEGSKEVTVKQFTKTESMLSDDVALELDSEGQFSTNQDTKWLMIDTSGRNLYVISSKGVTDFYDIAGIEEPKLVQHVNLLKENEKPNVIRFLLGDYSLMIGTDKGNVYQWFPVRDQQNDFALKQIRKFEVSNAAIQSIGIELARKGFAATDAEGEFHLFHSTSERHLGTEQVKKGAAAGLLTISPRADGAIVESADGKLVHFEIDNEHPDVSFASLWGKVWYEGYEEPTYTWQSSSASSDFEPKFSLMPLTFGTIKAALYSMLFAVPIAILAAIYTAFFMDKATRQWVKPAVEMIEALPTVILGFLAGLWLAPYMEANLPGFFALLIVIPLGIILFGYTWSRLPENIRLMVPVGRRAVLMIPIIIFLGWFALQLSSPIEDAMFDGNMRHWLTASAGIDFDQRNAMVIGFAMGFALIPTIFSVTEDAIYNVPSYLVNGSLALGASGWQTLVGVVLPTASPGIFSAIMLGFGRGVGETMIVLMASGNTPLMEVNIFEGMRTLSANLAVEMAEAEVASSHYRVLFLAGLVLFVFTFLFNTLAEVVRQRMRRKYGSL
ncbi:phosphate ABC transporter permease [Thiomicrorhabdus immobilis]|uniref:Phosphate ABC transporter permease n=1 Tax=Thiomicrorhabdus immobilis TaxID=2791037 RepID=A0ABM7MBU3_9GAMM|nr:ABC transporter permease subunit [Thiomicrorhabdus immobilis]BCN92836.1 phosphate ABC transporter permease [Thiomicrorhabdus immobilis]